MSLEQLIRWMKQPPGKIPQEHWKSLQSLFLAYTFIRKLDFIWL